MKRYRIFTALVIWLNLAATAKAQVASLSDIPTATGPVSIRPNDIYINPAQLNNLWMDDPVPASYYTDMDIDIQRRINKDAADWVVTKPSAEQYDEWTDIDHQEITPYTWKWIHIELSDCDDSSVTKVFLRRPNTWIKSHHAEKIGNIIYLNWPEFGVNGWATVKNIYPNQLDTRFLSDDLHESYVSMPVVGKFFHESSDVYNLYLKSQHPIGVTGNHPIWSADRKEWINANNLQIGEAIATHRGETTVVGIEKMEGRHTVYNLEVYRNHNYFVSDASVLVHNKNPPAPVPKPEIATAVPDEELTARLIRDQGLSSEEAAEFAKKLRQQETALERTSTPPSSVKVVKTPNAGREKPAPLSGPYRNPNTVREIRRSTIHKK
jgi:hypothetical protein